MAKKKNTLALVKNVNAYMELPDITNRLSEKLGLDEAMKFKAALSSAISTNPVLANECDPGSVINCGLIGYSLKLPPSPQLGYYYMVPYKNKKKNCKEATFQMGYKGYIQLALRSGYYRKLNVTNVKEGEFVSWEPLTENLKVNFIEDPDKREKAKTVGYCSFFEYTNGFTKMLYWTLERVERHADKYSPAYSLKQHKLLKAGKIPPKDLWKYSSFWYSDFDSMANKTMLRQLLSKWGSMSVEMQVAYEEDLKSERVSFTQAQETATKTIQDETGSEDVTFEPINEPDPEKEAEFKEKQARAKKKLQEAKDKKGKAGKPAFMEGADESVNTFKEEEVFTYVCERCDKIFELTKKQGVNAICEADCLGKLYLQEPQAE